MDEVETLGANAFSRRTLQPELGHAIRARLGPTSEGEKDKEARQKQLQAPYGALHPS